MNLKTLALATVTAACLAAAANTPVLAHDGEGRWHDDGLEILHSITLTDAQKAQVHTIEHAAWDQARPVMQQMHATHEQMATALLTNGPVTADQLTPLVTQQEQFRAQLDQIHLNAVLQVRALLTPDQLARAASLHQQLALLHEQEHEAMHAAEGGAE